MFGSQYYHGTIRKYVIAFGNLFNDLVLQRLDSQGNRIQSIAVPIAYGPKEKWMVRLQQDPDFEEGVAITLPRLGFEITGFTYDPQRKLPSTLLNCAAVDGFQDRVNTQYSPIPYDIQFSLSAFVQNADDGAQIAEQILPYFRPEFTTNINLIPDMDVTVDTPVVLQAMTVEDTYEGDYQTRRALIYNFEFVVKGYMYGPIRTSGLITRATTNIYDGIPPDDNTILTRTIVLANGNVTTVPAIGVIDDDDDGIVEITEIIGQNVWFTIYGDTGNTYPTTTTADLNFVTGTGDVLSTSVSGQTITIDHTLGTAGQILQANSTNNYWGPRVRTQSITSSASITPPADDVDQYNVTALAIDAQLSNPTGTPTNGQKMMIRILDDGTPRTLTYDSQYRAIGVTLPSTTTSSKTAYYECIYNSEDAMWDVIAVSLEI